MSTLTVTAYHDPSAAEAALRTLNDLQKQQLVTIDDAAILSRDLDGKPKIKQATDMVGIGALGGAFWGMLLGWIFFMPLLGAAVGAGLGAVGGAMADVGIDDDFIRRVGEEIKPGQAALFTLTENAVMDRVVDALKPFGGKLLHTNLSKQDEDKLREMVGHNG